MSRGPVGMVATRMGLMVSLGAGCGAKSAEEGVCPEGVIAIVGTGEWVTLESAIAARESLSSADPDAEIELCPGTFESRTLVEGSGEGFGRIKLRGHPDGTVLDGDGAGTVLTFIGDGVVELSDLTITNGYADAGGGGYRGQGSQTLILDQVRFQNNEAPIDGGAVRMYADDGGSVAIEDAGGGGAVFEDNRAGGDGGAIALYGEGFATFNPGTWTLNTNVAGGRGGAVVLQSAASVGMFGDFIATGNEAGDEGGVVFVQGTNSAGMVLGRVDAFDNRAAGKGGVIRLADGGSGDLALSSGDIQGNVASGGGAIAATRGWSVTVSGTAFSNNEPEDVLYAGERYNAHTLAGAFVCTADAGCSNAE
ncbi:MAG: hypothetical protein CL927_01530 [Deltaproteobacteria bacterium]|nr:hypothetical protein [Deltaproteobacteria bacterium]HCH65692.1 hypothetical protein [Deltaproteobacteria bacterium]